jgi:hypothetical protein
MKNNRRETKKQKKFFPTEKPRDYGEYLYIYKDEKEEVAAAIQSQTF